MRFWPKYQYDEQYERVRGLGDLVEYVLDEYLNFTQRHWIMIKLTIFPWNWGKDPTEVGCSCDSRKKILNHVFPFFWLNKRK